MTLIIIILVKKKQIKANIVIKNSLQSIKQEPLNPDIRSPHPFKWPNKIYLAWRTCDLGGWKGRPEA